MAAVSARSNARWIGAIEVFRVAAVGWIAVPVATIVAGGLADQGRGST
jgi:hypothetical protein